MGALGKELFTFGKQYWLIPFAVFMGLWMPIPFWAVYKYAPEGSFVSRAAGYIHTPVLLLYIGIVLLLVSYGLRWHSTDLWTGYLPYSVNGQWWYV
jgi:hypothetical protein